MAKLWPKSQPKGGPRNRKGSRFPIAPAGGGGAGGIAYISGELTTNGAFATDTAWTKDAGWAIAAGVATATASGAAAYLHQAVTIVTGATYEVTYTITAYTSGNVAVSFDNGPTGITRAATGTFTQHLVMPAGITEIRFGRVSSDFTGSIDNVSLRRIG
jgi:hypothetical protein